MGAIYRRELGSFFNSAIGTLFLPLMLMPRSSAICRFIQFTSRHIFCSPARSSRSVGLCVL